MGGYRWRQLHGWCAVRACRDTARSRSSSPPHCLPRHLPRPPCAGHGSLGAFVLASLDAQLAAAGQQQAPPPSAAALVEQLAEAFPAGFADQLLLPDAAGGDGERQVGGA